MKKKPKEKHPPSPHWGAFFSEAIRLAQVARERKAKREAAASEDTIGERESAAAN